MMAGGSPTSEAQPKVSIIIATLQSASTLERCLRSITEQVFTDWELLIADGGSTDGTIELIRRSDAHVKWWQAREDSGVYDAWNQALAHASGEFVCFLGADDAWSDRAALRAMVEAVGVKKPDLISARGLVIDASAQLLGTIGQPWDYKRIRRRMGICHPGALFRRRLFETLGLFETRYRIAADYEWMLRLPASTSHLFLDRVVVHVQEGGVSRRRWKETADEYWTIQARDMRVGRIRATLIYLDRMWRRHAARLLGLYY